MDRFEELAKGLAGGMKRREALRRMGGGLAGVLLASLGVRRAHAAPPPNKYCSKDCKDLYSPGGGNAYGKCVSDCEACVNSGGEVCLPPNFYTHNCEGQPNCVCFNTTEGQGFCGNGNTSCTVTPTCRTSEDCPAGWFCSPNTCCETFFGSPPLCVPPCSVTVTGPATAAAQGGPTLAGF